MTFNLVVAYSFRTDYKHEVVSRKEVGFHESDGMLHSRLGENFV